MGSRFDPSAFIQAEREQRSQALARSSGGEDASHGQQQTARIEQLIQPAGEASSGSSGSSGPHAGLPWEQDLLRFQDQPRPDWVGEAFWDELQGEVWDLSRQWGRIALDAGWSPLDLFGCNPVPFPAARRVDRDGLAMRIAGLLSPVRIISLTAAGAVLHDQHDVAMTFRPQVGGGSVMLWTAYAQGPGR